MSALGALVVSWGPALLKTMPYIIRAINELSGLWSEIRKTKREDDTVLKALKLLKTHQDDIDRFIEDPERRKLIMEGLVILMTKIQKLDKHEVLHESDKQDNSGYHKVVELTWKALAGGVDSPYLFEYVMIMDVFQGQNRSLCCDLCGESFNTAERRPLLLPLCGHTFCKFCLRKVVRPSCFRCPTCRMETNHQVEDLPTNFAVLRLLTEEDDFTNSKKWESELPTSSCCTNGRSELLASSCCKKGENELPTSSVTLSYEEQIEYAIFLSLKDMSLKKEENAACSVSQQDEAESFFLTYSQLEEQEERQERETFWSENSHESQYFSKSQPFYENSSATCPDCLSDKESDELEEPVNSDCRNMANTSQLENAEDNDVQLAITLQEKEKMCAGQSANDDLQLALRLQEEEIQCVGQSHRSKEMIDSQFCQGQTSVPELDGLSKKEKKRKIKEQEMMSIAIALSLSLEDAPHTDPPDASDN